MKNLKTFVILMLLIVSYSGCNKDNSNGSSNNAILYLKTVTRTRGNVTTIDTYFYDNLKRLVKVKYDTAGRNLNNFDTLIYAQDGNLTKTLYYLNNKLDFEVDNSYSGNTIYSTISMNPGNGLKEMYKTVTVINLSEQVQSVAFYNKVDSIHYMKNYYSLFTWKNGNVTRRDYYDTVTKKKSNKYSELLSFMKRHYRVLSSLPYQFYDKSAKSYIGYNISI
jgi:hypothetical protein